MQCILSLSHTHTLTHSLTHTCRWCWPRPPRRSRSCPQACRPSYRPPTRRYCAAPLHHSTTALLHYYTTALLHHCTTALHHCTDVVGDEHAPLHTHTISNHLIFHALTHSLTHSLTHRHPLQSNSYKPYAKTLSARRPPPRVARKTKSVFVKTS